MLSYSAIVCEISMIICFLPNILSLLYCAVPHSMDYSHAQDDCGACGGTVGQGMDLQAGRLWIQFLMWSLT